VKGFVWDEWGEDAARLFGEIYRGEHEGNIIASLFRRLDLPYNKYSEGSWNCHHNEIKRRVEVYKQNGTGLKNKTFRNLVFGPDRQQEPRTRDSVTVIGFATVPARKRNREKETEESLGSSDSTLSSDDETFQPTKLDGAAAADFGQYSFEDNESELANIRQNSKISDIFTGGAAINQKQPGIVKVVSKKTPKPSVRIQYPPVIGKEIQETMMNSPAWNKYVEHFSDGILFFTLFIAGGCEPEFYVKDKRQLMIIITMPESAYSAMMVLKQQGLGSGDQANNRVFTQLQASMDKRRKKAVEEMKSLPSNNVGGQVRHEYLVHIFERDMHCDFSSMFANNPLDNECYMDQYSKGTTWYCLVVNPIVQEATEVFKSAKPKMCGTRRREDDMDAEASPIVANNELIATVHSLASSLQTIQVGQQTMKVDQQRNRQFLETVSAQQDQLHQRSQWSEALKPAQSSAARAEAFLHP
jgi:hypothetical protein